MLPLRAAFAGALVCGLAAAAEAASIAITAPAAGATVAGTVTVTARAVPAAGASVRFLLDGGALGNPVAAPPYSTSWNTALGAGDTHVLTAVLRDASGAETTSPPVSVTVDNSPPALSVPAVSVTGSAAIVTWTTNAPAAGWLEYGPTTAYGSQTPAEPGLSLSHHAQLSGLTAAAPAHGRAVARNAAGAAGTSDDFVVAVATDTAPPAVVMMNPASGAILSSSVTLSANASDNVGVASVQFLLDGVELGPPATSAPFTAPWNTLAAVDGAHALTAVAKDAAGNSASAVVPVVVENAPPVIASVALGATAPGRAVVLWTTDKRADSQADYGPSPSYGSTTPLNPVRALKHSAELTGLAPGAMYHYRVRSRGASGVLAMSDDYVLVADGTAGAAASTGTAVAAAAAAADPAAAPQKILTPASRDGVNDKAVFGPDAQEVTITDVRGRQVFHGVAAGAAPIVWDCRDASGRVVESGVYIANIVVRGSKRRYQSFAVAK